MKILDYLANRILSLSRGLLMRSETGWKVLRWLHHEVPARFPYLPPHTPVDEARGRSWVPTDVRNSTIEGAGLGLFAREDVPAGTTIGEYYGDRVDSVLRWLRLADKDYVAQTTDRAVCVDARRRPEVQMRYINHHFDPARRNVKFLPGAFYRQIVTTRDVPAGEEFFADYGARYWGLHGISPDQPPA